MRRRSRIRYTYLAHILEYIGDVSILTAGTVRAVFTGSIRVKDVLRQMAVIGFDSLPITLLTIAFSGAVLSLHTAIQAHRFGLDIYVGYMVATAMAREAGPVLVAVVVAARVGSAIAAELGTMKVTEQIDALRALAVNPIEYLVVPRFVAAVLMLPALTILGDIVGTIGGMLVSAGAGISPGTFINSVQANLPTYDVWMGLLKTLAFGAIIAIIGCRQGMATSGGASGVGRATISSVVISIVLIYIVNYFLAALMFGEHLSVT